MSSASGAETTLLGLYIKFLVRGASDLVLLVHLRFKLEDEVL